MITKSRIIAAMVRNLPFARMQPGAYVDALFPDMFDQVADEITSTPSIVKTRLVEFEVQGHYEKTAFYHVIDKKGGEVIGRIKWVPDHYGYCFHPYHYTVYGPVHLEEITRFIETIMFLHHKKNKSYERNPTNTGKLLE